MSHALELSLIFLAMTLALCALALTICYVKANYVFGESDNADEDDDRDDSDWWKKERSK